MEWRCLARLCTSAGCNWHFDIYPCNVCTGLLYNVYVLVDLVSVLCNCILNAICNLVRAQKKAERQQELRKKFDLLKVKKKNSPRSLSDVKIIHSLVIDNYHRWREHENMQESICM